MLNLLIGLLVFWICLWVNNKYAPNDPPVKTVLSVIIVVALIVWLLTGFGLLPASVFR